MMDKAKRYLHEIQIKNKQKHINKLYEKDGLTDEVLREQIELNKMKNKLNISDKSKRIYQNYVQ